VNLAGFPALALPVPTGQRPPASLQLIGGPGAEALLLATGAIIEDPYWPINTRADWPWMTGHSGS
jgi:Asp-tRNA(Asn)/Glu-tRNA(Gln) amidotransferase A subunit family amidase